MAWQDRSYYRDRQESGMNPLRWLLSGSVPLFRFAGIAVRAHVSLVILIITVILFDATQGFSIEHRITSMTILFMTVLLHEFGHCFATRYMGGSADDILMWPLGGLASVAPPHRPWPEFVATAGGPLVNVVICTLCALGLWLGWHIAPPLNPFTRFMPLGLHYNELDFYLWWIYSINQMILLFNLLPILPLDGGRMLQEILWPRIGFGRSWYVASWVGLVGSGGMMLFAIVYGFNFWLLLLGVSSFMFCLQHVRVLKEAGPAGLGMESEDFGPVSPVHRRHRQSRLAIWKARRRMKADELEQQRVDKILDKVSHQGMQSLTWWEKRVLRIATEHQRQREMVEAQRRKW